jgi:hypothetical protein
VSYCPHFASVLMINFYEKRTQSQLGPQVIVLWELHFLYLGLYKILFQQQAITKTNQLFICFNNCSWYCTPDPITFIQNILDNLSCFVKIRGCSDHTQYNELREGESIIRIFSISSNKASQSLFLNTEAVIVITRTDKWSISCASLIQFTFFTLCWYTTQLTF